MFSFANGRWTFRARFGRDVEPRSGDLFGHAVAINGDIAVVSAPGCDFMDRREDRDGATDPNARPEGVEYPNIGAAHVYRRVGQVWSHVEMLTAHAALAQPPLPETAFGTSVDLAGNRVFVGAAGQERAYVIDLAGSLADRTVSMTSPGNFTDDGFGSSIAATRDVLVVGANLDDRGDPGPFGQDARDSGAAFVYTQSYGEWILAGYLKASNLGASDRFSEVAVDGDTLVVGAPGEDGDGTDLSDDSAENAGAVYVFR